MGDAYNNGFFNLLGFGGATSTTNLGGFSPNVPTTTNNGYTSAGAFNGSAFGFHFENPNSVWIVDAGINVNDKDSCSIQHWVRTTTDSAVSWFASTWAWKNTVAVNSFSPCFSLAGRVENGVLNLYTTTVDGGSAVFGTKRAANSQIYRVVINAATSAGTVTVVATAPVGTQYRGVSLPPYQRANLTCANGYATTKDLACVGSTCCLACKTTCPVGQVLVNTCSTYGDNVCMFPAAYATFQSAIAAAAAAVGTTAPPTVGVYALFRNPASQQLTPSMFTPDILTKIAAAAAVALQITSAAVTASVDPLTATVFGSDLTAAGTTRRALQAAGTPVGVRVLITIIASVAAQSPVVQSAGGLGPAVTDPSAIGAAVRAAIATPAVASALATRFVQTTGTPPAVCTPQVNPCPCTVACLGYATTTEAVAQVKADPTRTSAVVTSPAAAGGASSAASSGLSAGATAGVAIGVIIVVVCAAGIIYALTDGCGMNKGGRKSSRGKAVSSSALDGAAVANPAAAAADSPRFAVSPLAARA